MPDLTPNFDAIARPYRWLEYLTFGPFLERCRFYYLDRLSDRRRALILGDGDGRYSVRLLAENSQITVDAIDSSATMLELLTLRVSSLGPHGLDRLKTTQSTVQRLTLEGPAYDLVATNFFLDCITEHDIEGLILDIKPYLAPGAIWSVAEFAVPATGVMKPVSRLIIASLYRAFRLLTGLKVSRLPNYPRLLAKGGFSLRDQKVHLGGLLVSELWSLDSPPLKQPGASSATPTDRGDPLWSKPLYFSRIRRTCPSWRLFPGPFPNPIRTPPPTLIRFRYQAPEAPVRIPASQLSRFPPPLRLHNQRR